MIPIVSFKEFSEHIIPIWINHIKQDNDIVLITAGKEGKGKSTGGLWIREEYNKQMNKKSTIERSVALNTITFIDILYHAKRYDYLQHDECGDSLFSRDFAKEEVKDLAKAFMVIRGKNYFTNLVLPDLFMLDKYFRTFRAKGLIYFFKRTKRKTYFAFYFPSQIKTIIKYGKDAHDVLSVDPKFIVSVDDFSKFHEDIYAEYKEYKDNKIDSALEELKSKYVDEVKNKKEEMQKMALSVFNKLNTYTGVEDSTKFICDIFGIDRSTVYRWRKKEKELA